MSSQENSLGLSDCSSEGVTVGVTEDIKLGTEDGFLVGDLDGNSKGLSSRNELGD